MIRHYCDACESYAGTRPMDTLVLVYKAERVLESEICGDYCAVRLLARELIAMKDKLGRKDRLAVEHELDASRTPEGV